MMQLQQQGGGGYYGSGVPTAHSMHALRNAGLSALNSGANKTHRGSSDSQPMTSGVVPPTGVIGGFQSSHPSHYVDHVNNNHNLHPQQQLVGGVMGQPIGVCPPIGANNTQQYHQLAMANDYTKLDESISDSEPECDTPPSPHQSMGGVNNQFNTNCSYPINSIGMNNPSTHEQSGPIKGGPNRHSFITSSSQHHQNPNGPGHGAQTVGGATLPTSASFLSGGTLPGNNNNNMGMNINNQYTNQPHQDIPSNLIYNNPPGISGSGGSLGGPHPPSGMLSSRVHNQQQQSDVASSSAGSACGTSTSCSGSINNNNNNNSVNTSSSQNHSRPRMGISSTVPSALGRSVHSLPPYAANDIC